MKCCESISGSACEDILTSSEVFLNNIYVLEITGHICSTASCSLSEERCSAAEVVFLIKRHIVRGGAVIAVANEQDVKTIKH